MIRVSGLVARLLACAIVAFSVAHAFAEGDGLQVLWWQVGDWEDETGSSLGDVIVERFNGAGPTTAAELGVDSARIREVTSDTYLKMLDIDEYGNVLDFSLDGMNVPMTWVADVSGFSSGSAGYAFVIELGNYESGVWSTLAVSESASYADLHANRHVVSIRDTGSFDPQYATPWAPATYAVPEPGSGLLTLVGCMLLALKRRRSGSHV